MKDRGPVYLSEEEIDEAVIAEAEDESAWDEPVSVTREGTEVFSLSLEAAERARFFARLHREPDLQRWLRRVIEERLDLEEAAFGDAKRELAEAVSSPAS